MFKRIISAVVALFAFASVANAQDIYNSVATAYLTTTISQVVVFDSNMQNGGTFDFSVLAHNGGGRAGQSDTANVKIEFYNASNSLLFSQTTNYNGNLPNPNAICGNPCIDSSVPWTTITVSKTLSAADAANVAYAKVYMWGIDGSYWAGDYGPWYRAPTLSLNGGGNLLYNPEFGPYNNVNAQGWNISPSLGACQGAWGGSNACIVDNTGTPGRSTTGLVANQNGGGPSLTGGTTSGTAGGYNSTMSVSNPSGAPVVPAGPTVVSTAPGTPTVTTGQPVAGTPVVTTTTVVRTVNGVDANGNPTVTTYNDTVTTTTTPYTTTTTTTPTTVTTYSDGTTSTANGTPVVTTSSSSQTTTSTTAGGVQSVATTAPVDGTPVVVRGTTTTTSTDAAGSTTVSTNATRGTTVTTSSFADHAAKNPRVITVTRDTTTVRTTPVITRYTYTTPITTTIVAVTPITTTITTTPTTTVVDANGNAISVTAAGPGVDTVTNTTETITTTTNRNDVAYIDVRTLDVNSSTSSKSNSVDAAGLSNSIKFRNNTLVMGSPLDRADGAWAEPFGMFQNAHGVMSTQGASMGYQTTVYNNTVGASLDITAGDTKTKNGSYTEYSSYNGSAYILTKQDYFWYKGQVGYASTFHKNTLSIQEFGLTATNKARQSNVYLDNTLYAPVAWYGFRPYAGVLVNHSSIDKVTSMGSPLLYNTPDKKATTFGVPYAGLRYEFDKNITLDYRVTQSPDFKTVHGLRATVKKEIADDVFLQFTLGSEKGGRGYNNTYGMVGLVWKF